MQKKLMAVAVAGALAMPGLAAAQSVSLSGFFKIGLENIKIGQPGAARAGLHDSEMRVADNSSRMIFNMNEDLGGGLAAIGQVDFRFDPDGGGGPAANGNTWVGLRSATAGTLTIGRWDLHYGKSPSDLPNKAGALKAAAISLMDYMPSATGANTAIANATRTPNAIKWDSPNWSGFAVTVAYSTNQGGQESDLTSSSRKGSAVNINPSFTAPNFKVEWSNWNSKLDATAASPAAQNDQKGDTLNAWYAARGLKIGMAYNKSELKTATTKAERTAMTIPVNYSTGAHDLHFHYTRANKVKVGGSEVADTGAKMMAAAYVYNLSKRTSMGITYAKITNDPAAAYNFFTGGSTAYTSVANSSAASSAVTGAQAAGSLSSFGATTTAGEDPTLLALILRHGF
jgi:predicted porin